METFISPSELAVPLDTIWLIDPEVVVGTLYVYPAVPVVEYSCNFILVPSGVNEEPLPST